MRIVLYPAAAVSCILLLATVESFAVNHAWAVRPSTVLDAASNFCKDVAFETGELLARMTLILDIVRVHMWAFLKHFAPHIYAVCAPIGGIVASPWWVAVGYYDYVTEYLRPYFAGTDARDAFFWITISAMLGFSVFCTIRIHTYQPPPALEKPAEATTPDEDEDVADVAAADARELTAPLTPPPLSRRGGGRKQ